MKSLLRKLLVVILLLSPVSIGLSGLSPLAEARVTNCWKYTYYQYATGRCGGTDANPPYTTQWALMVQCSNGVTYTSGWRNAGANSVVVECPYGKHTVGGAWFLFR